MSASSRRVTARALSVLGLAGSVLLALVVEPAPPGSAQLALVEESAAGRSVSMIDTERSTTIQLARGLAEVDGPVWSPDGTRLAYATTSGETSAIFLVGIDGTKTRQVATGRSPAWSPDGTTIAFAAREKGNEEIFAVNPDAPPAKRLTAHPARDFSPLWAPDGAHIAFASGRSASSRIQGIAYGSEIHLMDADGSGVRALTANNACGLRNESEGKLNSLDRAAWTPDGRRLLYRAGVCKMDCRVCVIELPEGRTRPLVSERIVSDFALSPDGKEVAYAWSRGIYVVDLEGGVPRLLVQDAWGPAWSRDGRRIAFLVAAGRDLAARLYHIETIAPDGQGRRRITQRAGNYWALTWAPVPASRP